MRRSLTLLYHSLVNVRLVVNLPHGIRDPQRVLRLDFIPGIVRIVAIRTAAQRLL